jgi:catechol 1,2-dioxygenase
MSPAEKTVIEGYFDTQRSAEIVNARMAATTDPRLREVLGVIVSHMHAAVKEANITEAEWMRGIEFLTATGQMCSQWRQEFILLSDVLGVSMLVDALNHDRGAKATENTVLGPFHVESAPRYPNGANICLDGKGEPLVARGRVVDVGGRPIAGANVDVWQTNNEGFYDVQQKGIQPDWNLRGQFTSDEHGEYWFRSAKPRFYPIPDDGPVGKLLAALGRHPNRPAHIHFIVSAKGYETVTTHIFPADSPYLGEDPVFGVKESLIADFHSVSDPVESAKFGFGGPFWTVQWDFVLTAV